MTSDEDANFIRTLIGVLGALVVFSVVLMYFSNAIGDDEPTEEEKQAIAERIAPVGQVEVAPATRARGRERSLRTSAFGATGGEWASPDACRERSCVRCGKRLPRRQG